MDTIFHCYVIAQQFAQSYLCHSNEPLPNYSLTAPTDRLSAHMQVYCQRAGQVVQVGHHTTRSPLWHPWLQLGFAVFSSRSSVCCYGVAEQHLDDVSTSAAVLTSSGIPSNTSYVCSILMKSSFSNYTTSPCSDTEQLYTHQRPTVAEAYVCKLSMRIIG